MKYYTTVIIDKHPTLDFDINIWETLSEQEILKRYWTSWKRVMIEQGNHEFISEENCIQDWCIGYWATRNYWREMKDCIA